MSGITMIRIAAVLAFFFLYRPLSAQDARAGNAFGIDVRYTSGSRLFPDPFSPDPIRRNATGDLGSFVSYAAHYRRNISNAVEVQLAGEYLANDKQTADNYGTPTSDGFRMYGIELLGLFRMPFSTSDVGFYAGGGGGFVYGDRRLTVAGVEAVSVEGDLAFGIHVLFGIEYFFMENLSLRAEFQFRDPQITVKNRFSTESVVVNGITYRFPADPFESRINLDGNIYSLGLSWHW